VEDTDTSIQEIEAVFGPEVSIHRPSLLLFMFFSTSAFAFVSV
jgi:hypothetical protein